MYSVPLILVYVFVSEIARLLNLKVVSTVTQSYQSSIFMLPLRSEEVDYYESDRGHLAPLPQNKSTVQN